MKNDLNRFHDIFIECLDLVDKDYYNTTYENISKFHEVIENRLVPDNDNFYRYGERIFCYELYHQLRMKIDEEKVDNPSFLENLKLQGEVAKWQEQSLYEEYGLNLLDNEYIPDFLLHTAGKFHIHAYVIEVKSNPKLSSTQMMTDLKKISQFIDRLRYKRGIFLAININADEINKMIKSREKEIRDLKGRNSIAVICKKEKGKEETVFYLQNV